MHPRLLTVAGFAATLIFSAAPAAAQSGSGSDHHARSRDFIVDSGPRDFANCGSGGERYHHRRGDRFDCGGFGGFAYADGEWARYNNRSWDSDSYNDWWHDRPDRAFPRWVQEQQARGTCDPNRMWWSGSGWHC